MNKNKLNFWAEFKKECPMFAEEIEKEVVDRNYLFLICDQLGIEYIRE